MENDNVHDDAPEAAARSEESSDDGRLDSWKEIGAYLKRNVTTVRRWEKREGLPVHRHLHERRDSVYAYASEIEAWWEKRRNQLADNGANDDVTSLVPESAWRLPQVRLLWVPGAALLVVALAAAVLLARVRSTSRNDVESLRFSIFPPSQTTFGTASVSPDGRHLAFTASSYDGKTLLWVRPFDTLVARSLPETDDAAFPF